MYLALSESPRFDDSSDHIIDLLAELAALLTAHREADRARDLLEARREKLRLDPKRLRELESSLILHYARHHLAGEMLAAFRRSSAIALDLRPSFSALIQAYASMDRPRDAYAALVEMRISRGLSPSSKDFKAVVFAFGRCGMFEEMESLAAEMHGMGFLKDPVAFNMIIGAYAAAENHAKLEEWIDKMLGAGVRPSVRSLNAIARACPSLSKLPTSVTVASLFEHLAANRATEGEIGSVECLVKLWQQIEGSADWGSVWQLDLHGSAPASARVMLSCWLEEVSRRFEAQLEFPREVCIVTGWGKHSESGGRRRRRRRSSPIKVTVRDLLETAGSPFMVDSQNKGRLLAKPHAVMAWLRRWRR
jgi:pentatricopeptide repeat protein